MLIKDDCPLGTDLVFLVGLFFPFDATTCVHRHAFIVEEINLFWA